MDNFDSEIRKIYAANLKSGYKGVIKDFERFPENTKVNSIGDTVKSFLTKIYRTESRRLHFEGRLLDFIETHGKNFHFLYNLLNDDYSKKQLLNVAAYRILLNYFRFPNEVEYLGFFKECDLILDSHEPKVMKGELNKPLYKFYREELNSSFYLPKLSFVHNFLNNQYRYELPGIRIGVSPDDIIIDGGAFVGDSAIYFAEESRRSGKVYAFEFVPENVHFLKENLKCARCEEYVEIIEHALWSESGKKLAFSGDSWASHLVEKDEESSTSTSTVSIDDLFFDHKSIDFIKLDIEGAEYDTLLGAQRVLKKHKPKLAICLYHNMDDFYRIPKLLNDLSLGYRFYLKHATIYHEETVLFASVQ